MPEPHAITRARQRYGIEMTVRDLSRIAADVANGLTLHLSTQHDGCQRHAALIAVVSPEGKIITILPKENGGRKPRPAGTSPRAPKLPPLKARKRWP